ncbi:unnamed protein product [Haemonchus placei]|uniref:Protein MNN4-like n=1 Tax=Haemonchus placei TaxID=6290 RepID=A0A0N4X6L3_HAEPC|nr:unnamed protein product [Haemonchus placei]
MRLIALLKSSKLSQTMEEQLRQELRVKLLERDYMNTMKELKSNEQVEEEVMSDEWIKLDKKQKRNLKKREKKKLKKEMEKMRKVAIEEEKEEGEYEEEKEEGEYEEEEPYVEPEMCDAETQTIKSEWFMTTWFNEDVPIRRNGCDFETYSVLLSIDNLRKKIREALRTGDRRSLLYPASETLLTMSNMSIRRFY